MAFEFAHGVNSCPKEPGSFSYFKLLGMIGRSTIMQIFKVLQLARIEAVLRLRRQYISKQTPALWVLQQSPHSCLFLNPHPYPKIISGIRVRRVQRPVHLHTRNISARCIVDAAREAWNLQGIRWKGVQEETRSRSCERVRNHQVRNHLRRVMADQESTTLGHDQ